MGLGVVVGHSPYSKRELSGNIVVGLAALPPRIRDIFAGCGGTIPKWNYPEILLWVWADYSKMELSVNIVVGLGGLFQNGIICKYCCGFGCGCGALTLFSVCMCPSPCK